MAARPWIVEIRATGGERPCRPDRRSSCMRSQSLMRVMPCLPMLGVSLRLRRRPRRRSSSSLEKPGRRDCSRWSRFCLPRSPATQITGEAEPPPGLAFAHRNSRIAFRGGDNRRADSEMSSQRIFTNPVAMQQPFRQIVGLDVDGPSVVVGDGGQRQWTPGDVSSE